MNLRNFFSIQRVLATSLVSIAILVVVFIVELPLGIILAIKQNPPVLLVLLFLLLVGVGILCAWLLLVNYFVMNIALARRREFRRALWLINVPMFGIIGYLTLSPFWIFDQWTKPYLIPCFYAVGIVGIIGLLRNTFWPQVLEESTEQAEHGVAK